MAEQAEGYRAKVTGDATGDAARFTSVLTEYRKAPEVIRQRMYLETMQQMFNHASKVLVDTQGTNMLYLPLDKIVQQAAREASSSSPNAGSSMPTMPVVPPPATPSVRPAAGAAAAGSANTLSRDRGGR